MTTPTTHLVAFLGGVDAAGGAAYKVEIFDEGTGTFVAHYYSRGSGASWLSQGDSGSGDLKHAVGNGYRKFKDKTKPGRARVYTTPLVGGAAAGPLGPLQGTTLPVHPLVWQVGQPLTTLPNDVHRHVAPSVRAGAATSSAAPTTASVPVAPVSAVTVIAEPAVPVEAGDAVVAASVRSMPVASVPVAPAPGSLVMHPQTIPDEVTLQRYLNDPAWIMQEKIEGRRAQAHRLGDGTVLLTNRSGEAVDCPAHIAEALAHLAPGTSIDCEHIAVDEQGRAALYVGAAAKIQVLYAFDLIASPLLPNAANQWQDTRLAKLAEIVAAVGQPAALRVVPTANGAAAKQQLLRAIRARNGEGFIFRRRDSVYVSGRPDTIWRWRDRAREIDVVAMLYDARSKRWGFQPQEAGMVGALDVGLHDAAGVLTSLGEVGSGWSNEEKRELQQRWDQARLTRAALEQTAASEQRAVTDVEHAAWLAQHQFVVRVKTMGLNFNHRFIRASALEIRPAGDKQPAECTFQSEVGYEPHTVAAAA